ncbi:hypothetical protein CU102_25045 [Phyllobacterium brassicacearum]|uniref:Uncharacterized protein n=1 Tax=Phyllobacterium brassicacearum TaxID=314235 RepID=A0A2P7B840_9HYPH|nr:hypothetical protein CU102_25045 [Phyllobacterium brassicacearum]
MLGRILDTPTCVRIVVAGIRVAVSIPLISQVCQVRPAVALAGAVLRQVRWRCTCSVTATVSITVNLILCFSPDWRRATGPARRTETVVTSGIPRIGFNLR